ncbi:hypothetical protein SAMN05421693_1181, partial [Ectothiorhodospira magna]
MKVTRVVHAKRLNKGKVEALREQARRLGQVRSETWQCFGSIGGVGLSDRQNRQMDKTHAQIRDIVFQSVHKVVDKATVIAA